MKSIGVRELRQNASVWLRKVRGGASFEITVRGRPVARIVPLERPRGVGALIEAGLARPASGRLSERLAELGPPPEGPPLSEELERLRSDER
jgi:prevent-host-death family protein